MAGSEPKADRRKVLQAMAATSALGAWPFTTRARDTSGPDSSKVTPFELAAVHLLPGPFATARDLDARYLLSLEPDRLLHNFRANAGLAPKAPVYGGWESKEPWIDIRCHGHTLGHYLSACAMMTAATADPQFQERVAYIVTELSECQRARGDGLICAFPDGSTQLDNALAGKPIVGVPWYTLHKIMAGLRDAHTFANNPQALVVLTRLADWIETASRTVTEAQFQKMLEVEHGGMNEVLADLHALTGEGRYLALAQRFNHRALLEPLAARRDTLDGLHANTQIPKVIGFSRLHDLTGNEACGTAAQFFWRVVTKQRSFATGGHGDGEHFFPVAEFDEHLYSAKTMETCGTYNMLRLTRALFLKDPSADYADYYERALFNDILASQDPTSGLVTYFQATRPGYVKLYCSATDSFWCCTGTGMENHAKYGDSIYFHSARALYINLFIASQLQWREKGLQLTQSTRFPDEAGSKLVVHVRAPIRIALKIRQPRWCQRARVSLNGVAHRVSAGADGYLEIDRVWRDGDTIDVELPMRLGFAAIPGSSEIGALTYGPLVLAARCGSDGISPGADIIVNERTSGDMLKMPMALPQLDKSVRSLEQHLVRRSADSISFGLQTPQRPFELIPYYRIAHERYNLYWRIPVDRPHSLG